jgi:hypothetical protein
MAGMMHMVVLRQNQSAAKNTLAESVLFHFLAQ